MAGSYSIFDDQGYTSTIYALEGLPPRVCKAFNDKDAERLFPVERAVYERFTKHDHPSSILKYYGLHEEIAHGLVLERAENRNVLKYLWDRKQFGQPGPSDELLYRWADQAAEGLGFAHSLGICNSDVHPINFFLDAGLNLKVGDWAGASIDGSISYSSYRLHYRLFDSDGNDVPRVEGFSARTEVFALGTAIYYMVTGQEPWPELEEPQDRAEIKRRISAQEFPDVSALPVLGSVVDKCWRVELSSMSEVRQEICKEAKQRGYFYPFADI